MAKQKYSKSFRMKLEKIKAAREARETQAAAAEAAKPFDPFRTLWHEFLTVGDGKHGRAQFVHARAPDPDERPFRFCSEIYMTGSALRSGLGDGGDIIDVPPPWKPREPADTDASE